MEEENKVTLQDRLIDLLTKNNTRLIQYIFDQIEIRYDLHQTEVDPQDIENAIEADKDWTEVE